ncbi:MAG: family 20 glycosylhydrolase, partial [bacterium]
MKKALMLAVFFGVYVKALSQTNKNSIITQPAVIKPGVGSFLINQGVAIFVAPNQPELLKIANMLNAELKKAAGFTLNIENSPRKNGIHFILSPEEPLGNEGYRLAVTTEDVSIFAPKPAGLFYGLQTLLQLMPKEIESKQVVQNISWTVPAVQITDRPRFGWRGLMLDVSRHFFTVDEVKAFIDDMARYKYNLMHFHLTDDQGWRLEIKSLPKLTEVGAWNVKKTGRFNYFTPPADNEPRDFGGFYTQEQMKELIRY